MSATTAIEWTDSTWSPVTGCSKVSVGCDHCYADSIAHRFAGTKAWPNGFDVTLWPDRLDIPLRWRNPRRIFVCSTADLFHDSVPDEYIARVFAVMAAARHHTFQVLTKRHARMRSLLSSSAFVEAVIGELYQHADPTRGGIIPTGPWDGDDWWPLWNVWLGVSTENQQWANIRIPALLDTPAAVRFISAEPLLGPITLAQTWLGRYEGRGRPQIDWCIVGGESGHGARPMHLQWVRSLRDQCTAAGVPFFLKQWGEWGPAVWKPERLPGETDDQYKARAEAVGATHAHTGNPLGNDTYHIYKPNHRPWSCERGQLAPGDAHAGIRRWGKKHSGRELDGREWSEFPQQVTADG